MTDVLQNGEEESVAFYETHDLLNAQPTKASSKHPNRLSIGCHQNFISQQNKMSQTVSKLFWDVSM